MPTITEGDSRAFPGEFGSSTLTKREYMATHILTTLLADAHGLGWHNVLPDTLSKAAIEQTDSLIKKLNGD